MKNIYLILLCCIFFNGNLLSQNLLNSKANSTYTYIYKITQTEAKTIFKKGLRSHQPEYFHTLVDSFPTFKTYTKKLPQGHYLKTYVHNTSQKVFTTSVHNFNAYILNNNKDLKVQVYDLQGKLIENAVVTINNRKINYNTNTSSFVDRKSNKKGLLGVTVDGFTAYYQLSRKYNNSQFKRVSNEILYNFPVKYVWIPIKFTSRIPQDGINSIKNWYTVGVIGRIKHFSIRTFHKVVCLFDNYYCDYEDNFQRKIKGYLVFNKPMFKPSDTIKLKAFITNENGKPVNKPMMVTLYNGRKTVQLATIQPYRKGAYSFRFFIHDSLQLKLDKNYYLRLEHNNKEYISESFRYEDYELKGNKLEITSEETKHYKNDTIIIKIEGTDINNLKIEDGRLEVFVETNQVQDYFGKNVFIPDTLLFFKKKMEPDQDTEIEIHDTNFPTANFSYAVHVRMLTSDNETISKKLDINYVYKANYLDIKQEQDTLVFEYFDDKKSASKLVTVSVKDNFGNIDTLFQKSTPFKEKVNPYYASYRIQSDSLYTEFHLSNEDPLIQCITERTSDSIFVKIKNPLELPFHYNVFKKNKRLKEAYTKSLTFHEKSDKKKLYYVNLNYIWGGKIIEKNYEIPYKDKEINITVTEPKIINPGQKTTIELAVTDKEGKPIKGLDITAFSINKKFGYAAPSLPYLGKSQRTGKIINNFSIDKKGIQSNQSLNLPFWNNLATLDSIAYYKFIYPGSGIYKNEINSPDAETQFAPFIFDNGNPIAIHVIYVDHLPIHFSWTTKQLYSFPIKSGKHHVKLRTANNTFEIDSLFFNEGKKTIFSIDSEKFKSKNEIVKAKNKLSKYEKNNLKKYLVPYRFNFRNNKNVVFLNKNDVYQRFGPSNGFYKSVAGPFVGEINFADYNVYQTQFRHEYGFEYDFSKNLIKMRSVDMETYFPKRLTSYGQTKSIYDFALNLSQIKKEWTTIQNNQRIINPRYVNPQMTVKGNGQLKLDLEKEIQPLNILLFKQDDINFTRIYNGGERLFQNLMPSYYRIVFINKEAFYQMEDSIRIEPNGYNYLKIAKLEQLKNDGFIKKVDSLLTSFYQKPYSESKDIQLKRERNEINSQFRMKYVGTGNFNTISGYVSDDSGPLPGVSVLIQGTTIGTETDFDGYYSIIVNPGDVLQFSYIGMDSVYKQFEGSDNGNVVMNASSENLLEEVVVVAYGASRSKRSTSYAVSATSVSLSGKAAGAMIINDSDGSYVRIRGLSHINPEDSPLYIIDGMIYNGDFGKIKPEWIDEISVLKGSSATSLYGSRAANGVIIITTKKGIDNLDKKLIQQNENLVNVDQTYSIRNNFSDEAFWQPQLSTDEQGKVKFEVTFPDDITTWDTYYLAMNNKKQTGSNSSEIKSYKELMAQLYVPRFLIKGDTVIAIGKTQNITSDSIPIKSIFEINGQTIFSKDRICKSIIVDSLTTIANCDSLVLSYTVDNKDNYMDGEKRNIPVFKKGLEKTNGAFVVMDQDTSLTANFDPKFGEVNIYAKTDILEVIEEELERIILYKYDCNEQLASKLKALLTKQRISNFKKIPFKERRKIDKLIRVINKYQKSDGLWGWWKKSYENEYVSLHVLEALLDAQKAGYNSQIDAYHLQDILIYKLENTDKLISKVRILKILREMDIEMDYEEQIRSLKKYNPESLFEKLHLSELIQICDFPYSLDYLKNYKKESLFGNTSFSDESDNESNLWDNEIQNTILAYKLLRKDNTANEKELRKIRQFFLEKRNTSYWRNTYESIKIVECILPDFLKDKKDFLNPKVTFSGSYNDTIDIFPFECKFQPNSELSINKTGSFPVYLTYYQKYWEDNPTHLKKDFEVNSFFENRTDELIFGKPTKLITELTVHKDAEYVMLNIPIPAGCTYDEKIGELRHETYREYFKNETTIFFEYLPEGFYTIELKLLPKFSGTFLVNPSQVELMYFPTYNANDSLKTLRIK